jgi:hypothetical protein
MCNAVQAKKKVTEQRHRKEDERKIKPNDNMITNKAINRTKKTEYKDLS